MDHLRHVAPQPRQHMTSYPQILKPAAVRTQPESRGFPLLFPAAQGLDEQGRRLDYLLPLTLIGPLIMLPQQGKIARSQTLLSQNGGQRPGMLRHGARHGRQHPGRAPGRYRALAYRGDNLLGKQLQKQQTPRHPALMPAQQGGHFIL